VVTTHIPAGFQIENIFTKELPQNKFQDLVSKLRMSGIHLPT